MLTVYSLGDVDLMIKMAQAAELAFSDGGIGYSGLVSAALGFTLLSAAFKQAFDPQQFHVKDYFIALFTFLFLMTPKVDFVIESARTGEISQPMTLPFGIVGGAWISTQIGGGFATSMADSYASLDPMFSGIEPGYSLDPLLALLRSRGMYPETQDTINLANYIEACVFRDAANEGSSNREIDLERISTGTFVFSDIQVNSESWETVYTDKTTHQNLSLTCKDAYTRLQPDFADASAWSDGIKAYMYSKVGTDSGKVNTGLQLLMGDTVQATDLYRTNLMNQIIAKVGARSYYLDPAKRLAYHTEYEAMQQRHIGQAAQSSFFLEAAPALITWFEVFIFVIAPFLPVMFALGKMGASMAMKCFFFLIAVNFWPVIQVGVNVYLRHYFSQLMCGTAGYDGISASCMTNSALAEKWSIASLGGMNASYTNLETFVSTAATIQTMVPALAMMIVFGSVHTMLNASQKAQQGANTDPKNVSPDSIKNDGRTVSVAGASASWTSQGDVLNSYTAGQVTKGSGTTFSGANSYQAAASQSSADVASVGHGLTASSQDVVAEQNSYNKRFDSGETISDQASLGNTYQKGVTTATMNQVAASHGMSTNELRTSLASHLASMSEEDAKAFLTKFSGKAGLEYGGFGFSLSSDVSETQRRARAFVKGQNISNVRGWQDTWGEQLVATRSENMSTVSQEQYSHLRAKAGTNTESDGAALQNSWARNQALSEQYQQARQRANEVKEAETRVRNAGGNTTIRYGDLLGENDDRGESMFSLGNVQQMVTNAGLTLMSGRFGDDFNKLFNGDPSRFNANEIEHKLEANAAEPAENKNLDARNKEMQNAWKNELSGMQKLLESPDGLRGLIDKAHFAADGKSPLPEAGMRMEKLMDLISSREMGTGVFKGAGAAAVHGAALQYLGRNGTVGGNDNGVSVGAALSQVAEAMVVDRSGSPEMFKNQLKFGDKTFDAIGKGKGFTEQQFEHMAGGHTESANDANVNIKPDSVGTPTNPKADTVLTDDEKRELKDVSKNAQDKVSAGKNESGVARQTEDPSLKPDSPAYLANLLQRSLNSVPFEAIQDRDTARNIKANAADLLGDAILKPTQAAAKVATYASHGDPGSMDQPYFNAAGSERYDLQVGTSTVFAAMNAVSELNTVLQPGAELKPEKRTELEGARDNLQKVADAYFKAEGKEAIGAEVTKGWIKAAGDDQELLKVAYAAGLAISADGKMPSGGDKGLLGRYNESLLTLYDGGASNDKGALKDKTRDDAIDAVIQNGIDWARLAELSTAASNDPNSSPDVASRYRDIAENSERIAAGFATNNANVKDTDKGYVSKDLFKGIDKLADAGQLLGMEGYSDAQQARAMYGYLKLSEGVDEQRLAETTGGLTVDLGKQMGERIQTLGESAEGIKKLEEVKEALPAQWQSKFDAAAIPKPQVDAFTHTSTQTGQSTVAAADTNATLTNTDEGLGTHTPPKVAADTNAALTNTDEGLGTHTPPKVAADTNAAPTDTTPKVAADTNATPTNTDEGLGTHTPPKVAAADTNAAQTDTTPKVAADTNAALTDTTPKVAADTNAALTDTTSKVAADQPTIVEREVPVEVVREVPSSNSAFSENPLSLDPASAGHSFNVLGGGGKQGADPQYNGNSQLHDDGPTMDSGPESSGQNGESSPRRS